MLIQRPEGFEALVAHHFPGVPAQRFATSLRDVDQSRQLERDDLRHLLCTHRAWQERSEDRIAEIVIAGCMGQDHLWQDLGLWSREELSTLLMHNFPALAGKNTKNMKWKKFFYKQLCDAESIKICRAPRARSASITPNASGPKTKVPV